MDSTTAPELALISALTSFTSLANQWLDSYNQDIVVINTAFAASINSNQDDNEKGVHKLDNFVELKIPLFPEPVFERYFRMKRSTFEVIHNYLSQTPEYNPETGRGYGNTKKITYVGIRYLASQAPTFDLSIGNVTVEVPITFISYKNQKIPPKLYFYQMSQNLTKFII